MLQVKVIPVKRFRVVGLLYCDNKIFINVKSNFPMFYVIGHEISHMLEMRYVDYVYSMGEIVVKYIKDIGDINGDSEKYKNINKYLNSIYDDYRVIFNNNDDKINLLSMLFELVGDVVGEFWLQYEFWELFKIGVSDEMIKLADLGIEIIRKDKRVIDVWNSRVRVLDMFCNLDEMRYEIVSVVRRNLEGCVSSVGEG